jgi:hypothetical protein
MWSGMDDLLLLFNFVGKFDHLPKHTKLLLECVRLWKYYGKHSASDTNSSASEHLLDSTSYYH